MTERFLLASDYIARKSLIAKTVALPRTVTSNLLPAQDRVLNLGSSTMAFDTVYARNIVLDNPIGGGGGGLTGPTGPAGGGGGLTGPTGPAMGSDGVIYFGGGTASVALDVTGLDCASDTHGYVSNLNSTQLNFENTVVDHTVNTITSFELTMVNLNNQMSILAVVPRNDVSGATVPLIQLSNGIDTVPLSQHSITPQTSRIYAFNSDDGENVVYSTIVSGHYVYPDATSPYVTTNNFTSIGNGTSTVRGGTYAEYGDGTNNTRVYMGFNSDATPGLTPVPSIGAVNNNATPTNLTCISPITMVGSTPSANYCTISASDSSLSIKGGPTGTTPITVSSAGTAAGFLKIEVNSTPYLIPLMNVP